MGLLRLGLLFGIFFCVLVLVIVFDPCRDKDAALGCRFIFKNVNDEMVSVRYLFMTKVPGGRYVLVGSVGVRNGGFYTVFFGDKLNGTTLLKVLRVSNIETSAIGEFDVEGVSSNELFEQLGSKLRFGDQLIIEADHKLKILKGITYAK